MTLGQIILKIHNIKIQQHPPPSPMAAATVDRLHLWSPDPLRKSCCQALLERQQDRGQSYFKGNVPKRQPLRRPFL